MKKLLLFLTFTLTLNLVFGQGNEDFTAAYSVSNSSSYMTRTWTGNTTSWTSTDSRVDQSITGRSICIRDGELTSASVPGGIGSLTFTTKGIFSGGTGTLDVLINGSSVGTAPFTKDVVETTTISNINVSGNIDIQIVCTGSSRCIIDDLSWTAYSAPVAAIVSLSASASFASEDDATVITLTATADQVVTGAQTVDLDITGTGITSSDYTLSAPQITIADGQTTGTVTLTIIDDNDVEPAETLYVEIINPSSGITIGAANGISAIILDNDFCSISTSGLANLSCNDNGTSQAVADDFLTFDLDPAGTSIGSSYSVSVSAGTITPTTASYGSSTTFTLNNGSAGGGNVTVTITDAASGTCTLPVNIVDPGVCSVPCTPTTGTDTQTACDSYTWVGNNNTVYTTSGVYTATLQTVAGCDSVVTLDLTINNSSTGSETVAACDSYTWSANNTTYTASGVYTATLTNAANCDSIATLNLTINTPTTGTDTQTACDSYTWVGNNNTVYTTSGVYTATLQTAAGCDSVVTLDLTINNSSTGSETVAACDSYTWSANNTTYTASGVYTATLTNAANCDSIATLNLAINTPTTGTDTQTACDSYTWVGNNNTVYTATGVYTATLQTVAGCDSVVTLNLTINTPTTGTDVQTACDSFDWIDGNTYTASNNTATFTIAGGAANGCDSLVTLDLTINTADATVTTNDPSITANAVNATYQWIDCSNNSDIAGETNATFTATANGSYAVKVTENGCTSTSSCVSIVTVGLEENIFNDVKIYPNPNNGQFTISFGEVVNPTVSIYTVDSKLVYLQEEVNDKNVSIELLDEPGVYFITISKGAYNYSTRVVVQ